MPGWNGVDPRPGARHAVPLLAEFCRRTGLDRTALENLIMVGAFDSFGPSGGRTRREMLWDLPEALRLARDGEFPIALPDDEADLPPMTVQEKAGVDYRVLGLSTSSQVMEFYRPKLKGTRTLRARDLPRVRNGERVRIAGLVTCRQRPGTAKGFVFITLEDETGLANIVVNPRVVEQYRQIVRAELLVIVEGILQNESGVINILAQRLESLSSPGVAQPPKSRDFH